ncbi:MAG: MotA/TolQ/ExbB proton channel family protein [Armatimonadetes bacterium]|nr:MotA/TolQ/ExbB proton channel family protein [Armatimonadota bacterium]
MTLIGLLIALVSVLAPLSLLPEVTPSHPGAGVWAGVASAFGATFGVLMACRSVRELLSAVRALRKPVLDGVPAQEVRELARTAQRAGLHAIRHELDYLKHPFVLRAAGLIAAQMPHRELREVLRLESQNELQARKDAVSVFSVAASSAPAVGTVSSLLLMMALLQQSDAQTLLQQLAVCFVPTATGMLAAHLLFAPLAARISHEISTEQQRYEALVSALASIRAEESVALVNAHLDSVAWPVKSDRETPEETSQVLARPMPRKETEQSARLPAATRISRATR